MPRNGPRRPPSDWTATGSACCRSCGSSRPASRLLTGFLLTLPFQPRFDGLSATMRVVYLATVGCSVAATVLLEAPVAMHRVLFRRHRTVYMVSAAHRFAYCGLLLMGLALTGVTVIIFGAVAGPPAGAIAGACAGVAQLVFGCCFRCGYAANPFHQTS